TTAYLVGSLAGGFALGGLAGLVGQVVPTAARTSHWSLGVLALLCFAGLVLDLRGAQSVPSWRRQVDERWLTAYRGWVYGLGFGVQLGFGLVTIITSTSTYAVVLLAALSGQVGAGLAIGGTFGLVRALPSLLMARVQDRRRLHDAFDMIERWAVSGRVVARLALGVAGVVLGAAAVGS
ncbi:MAG TPA: hypothetical protein VGN19_05105, partial [Pedococcus sp.]|nr:hypothetical protein [Pedococcus sp.]